MSLAGMVPNDACILETGVVVEDRVSSLGFGQPDSALMINPLELCVNLVLVHNGLGGLVGSSTNLGADP